MRRAAEEREGETDLRSGASNESEFPLWSLRRATGRRREDNLDATVDDAIDEPFAR